VGEFQSGTGDEFTAEIGGGSGGSGGSGAGNGVTGSGYRYGFNGKENDNEIKGEGGQQDYGMRIYDPRVGKFLSVDPITQSYPMLTPYQFASNTPIQAIDLDGLEAFFVHGTTSNSTRWTGTASAKKAVQTLLKVTNNEYYNIGFNWKAPIYNGEKMRAAAAQQLADYVSTHKVEGQEITLIGHSHGGNVAIQAAKIIYEMTGKKVNIITIATPAYNKKGDKENPETQKNYINDHIAIWNRIDGVSGGLAGDDYYTNSTITKNVEINVEKYYKRETVVGSGSSSHKITTEDNLGAHSADVEHPEILQNAIDNQALKKLNPVSSKPTKK
jgi:RHS repeat-associated protein